MKLTYRQFVDHLKQRQRMRLRPMTRPDDDWFPEAHFVLDGGLRTVPLDLAYFADRLSKRLLVNELLVPAIRAGRARMFGLQLVMYTIRANNPDPVAQNVMSRPEYDPVGLPDFETIPGREEQLMVTVWDPERAETWIARIDRPAKGAPHLALWSMANIGSLWGPMFDPITEALR
jgi:hypothetical protein